MGTNFYIIKDNRHNKHIGKRSAAGLYCWDCMTTLCIEGESRVHYDAKWNEVCPKCGSAPEEEPWTDNSVGRELGFNKSIPQKKKGVKSCSSFSWAMPKEDLGKAAKYFKLKVIKDEYGRKYSKKEFMQMLEECPIQYTDSIGTEFS